MIRSFEMHSPDLSNAPLVSHDVQLSHDPQFSHNAQFSHNPQFSHNADSIVRSRNAERVVQAAYGSLGHAGTNAIAFFGREGREGRGGSEGYEDRGGHARVKSDGLVETLVTIFATIAFGLGWASIETQTSEATEAARRDALTPSLTLAMPSAARPTGASAEKGYARGSASDAPFVRRGLPGLPGPLEVTPSPGAARTQWTEKPPVRSKR
jgi:hypothetical protein